MISIYVSIRNAVHFLKICFHREKQSRVVASSMKKVLLLGAGYVSAPVVEYLTAEGVAVTAG